MPNLKSQPRSLTRELKCTGLPLPIRTRLAKLSVRSYLICDTLRKYGATIPAQGVGIRGGDPTC